MNDLRKAAEMALEALEWNYGTDLENIENCMAWLEKMNATIPALRQALAQPEQMTDKEKVAQWMIQKGYATGHGDTVEDLLKELEWQILENWHRAMVNGVETEREACAKVCDEAVLQLHETVNQIENSEYLAQCAIQGSMKQAAKLAAAIRARSEK